MKMCLKCIFLSAVILLSVGKISCQDTINNKICTLEPRNSDACQQLARDLKFACHNYLHSIDCLLGIKSGQSHVGRISGEQALLGANLASDNVKVLGEIRTRHAVPETVVIVKTTIPDGFVNLRNKTLCHPGFENDRQFSRLLLMELENAIIRTDNKTFCAEESVTLIEKHVKFLSQFLGKSCRPGLWSQKLEFDKTLKEKYGSLCELCGPEKCNTRYADPFKESLTCLTDNDADVAITTLVDAQAFFNNTYNRGKYKYLCKNGSSISSAGSCTWSSLLPDVIIAESNTIEEVRNYLMENLGPKIHTLVGSVSVTNQYVEQALTRILNLERYETISLQTSSSSGYQSLRDYVTARRTVPNYQSSQRCDRTLKWCTYTDMENEKCKWLSQAAMNWGIQPVVLCARTDGEDELSCLDDIKKKKADIVVASADSAYVSLNKGLTTIAYPETDTRYLSTVLVVKRRNDSSIKKFEDLKGKKACISRFGGKEHLAFIDTLRKKNIVDDSNCDYGNLLSDFVSNSCVPGVRSNLIHESTDAADKDKLCSLCRSINVSSTASFCNDDVRNKYFGSRGALECLEDNVADFAVISKLNVRNYTNYQVICKNNTLSSSLQVDDGCALDVIATSVVVSEANNSKNEDIILALYEFETWFGRNLDKSFHLFDRFNETKDLLFRDSTPGLSFSAKLPYMKDYQDLLNRAKDCKDSNGSVTISKSIHVSMILLIGLFGFY